MWGAPRKTEAEAKPEKKRSWLRWSPREWSAAQRIGVSSALILALIKLASELIGVAGFYHQQDLKREADERWSGRQVAARGAMDPAALETQSPDGAFRTKAEFDARDGKGARMGYVVSILPVPCLEHSSPTDKPDGATAESDGDAWTVLTVLPEMVRKPHAEWTGPRVLELRFETAAPAGDAWITKREVFDLSSVTLPAAGFECASKFRRALYCLTMQDLCKSTGNPAFCCRESNP